MHTPLISSLQQPGVFAHDIDRWQVIETHISWVILCGDYAYKIKKSLNLGFLDFTTLEKRKFYCEEELRLNSRLAPDLYLEVVAITGSLEQPRVGGNGEACEYAVKMRRFSQQELLSDMAAEHRLDVAHIDEITRQVAAFHLTVPAAPTDSRYGSPESVQARVHENYTQILEHTNHPEHRDCVARLKEWTDQRHLEDISIFEHRKCREYVRECHGDMHLGNMALVNGKPVIFDGIEFNPDLYWIDVMSEVAFLVMDLENAGNRDFAYRFLNGYLELTGDYVGLQVLRYYLTYRATVRSKIACIRLAQHPDHAAADRLLCEFEGYLELAMAYTRPSRPVLMITHGLAGSGKSTLSASLCEKLRAIRIRSDRERRRMYGEGNNSGESAQIERGVYSSDVTLEVYARLEFLATAALGSGFAVIIDASFLKRAHRDEFRDLARRLSVPLRILAFHADAAVLRERVAARQAAAQDISEADVSVLEHQLELNPVLDADERSETVLIDTSVPWDAEAIVTQLKQSLVQSP